jgi:glycosyltransferase involved in cell wall biosynthesis
LKVLEQLTPIKETKEWLWDRGTSSDLYKSLLEIPKITIVTPSFNQGAFIEETIRSILLQNYPNLEYIIIDGGSTDNTIEIIKKYEPWIAYWISEKDHGQAEAINKGIAKSTGLLFNWINSDDRLPENALFKVAKLYNERKFNLLAGSVKDFKDTGEEWIRRNFNLTPEKMMLKSKDMYFHQPGIWYRTDQIKKLGGLKTKYHYCFDWHLVIRYLINNLEITYTEEILAEFRLHEASKTVSVPIRFQDDNIEIARELKDMEYFFELRKLLEYHIIMKEWYVNLIKIENSSNSKILKILKIINQSLTDIPNRWSRYTAGTIRNIINS